VNEHEAEPVRGLPARLPAGETILWQGSPLAWPLARRAFHIGNLAIYFVALEIWHIARLSLGGDHWRRWGQSALWMTGMSTAAILLLIFLAWLISRTTVYTLTNRRLVIRFGVALPMTINLPFTVIDVAGLRAYGDGSGDIPLSLVVGERISFPVLWPHVRPWRLSRAEPMLRSVPDAVRVARILAQALAAALPAQLMPDRGERVAAILAGLRPPASIAV
jgi:Bacterial PH domain